MPLFPSYGDVRRLEVKIDALRATVENLSKEQAEMGWGLHRLYADFQHLIGETIMPTLADIQTKADDVLARVTANTSALDSVKTLLQSQGDQIATLTQELKDAIANGADPTALQAVADKLDAVVAATDAQAAAEAALANTPAATT